MEGVKDSGATLEAGNDIMREVSSRRQVTQSTGFLETTRGAARPTKMLVATVHVSH
jgi:hypothetical protein